MGLLFSICGPLYICFWMYILSVFLDLVLDNVRSGSGEVVAELRNITCLVTVQYRSLNIDAVTTVLLLLPMCNPEARSEAMGSIWTWYFVPVFSLTSLFSLHSASWTYCRVVCEFSVKKIYWCSISLQRLWKVIWTSYISRAPSESSQWRNYVCHLQ